MAFLMFMRARFLWWPLHPLGLPFQPFHGAWTAVGIVWLFKVMILKYGGVRVFQNAKPFFLGLILGQLLSTGAWFIMDLALGVVGNKLYN